ncbi:hypothetical protein HQ590_05600 [bacterium]|nr:hypothetical protein [bacterium]
MESIKRGPDHRLLFCLENTSGYPAMDVAVKKLGAENLRFLPADLLAARTPQGDWIAAFRADGAVGRHAAKRLGLRIPALPPGGYRIECVTRRSGRALVIIGGDLFGMLAGLADALINGELTRRAFLYRGGDKTEKPAFPLRYYWTWDHSTNWVLDDPGNQFHGAANAYLKKPETFLEDYRRLVDHCLDMRFNGIALWGFLRDAHGGERHAGAVAQYAADRGVAILPGAGVTGYGGIYYCGNHPANLETHLAAHPQLGNLGPDGTRSAYCSSPYAPENQAWIQRSIEWLYRNFPIGGINLENMDFLVDFSAAGKRMRRKIRSGEPDFLKDQFVAYRTALETVHAIAPEKWNTYATYCGFSPADQRKAAGPVDPMLDVQVQVEPYFARRLPPSAIAQWTIGEMLLRPALPLRAWLNQGPPPGIHANPRWPRGLRPPTPRSAGFIHQPSQCCAVRERRSNLVLSSLAEACFRAHEAGMEGISLFSEVTSRTLVWELNYLAMRHWTYHPSSTLAEFAQAELTPRTGGRQEALDFVRALCLIEEQKVEAAQKLVAEFRRNPRYYPNRFDSSATLTRHAVYRRWMELFEWTHTTWHPGRIQGFTDLA